MKETPQLKAWKGKFGIAYTNRNHVSARLVRPLYREILKGLKVKSALEVGCNAGHNLSAIADIFSIEPVGIEPNAHARKRARKSDSRLSVLEGNIFNLPFKNAQFDLVVCSGVLIHVALKNLDAAIGELNRVSQKYILSQEYTSDNEEEIFYRGHRGLLWKRDFKTHFSRVCPNLKVVRSGYVKRTRGTWWLFKIGRSPHK